MPFSFRNRLMGSSQQRESPGSAASLHDDVLSAVLDHISRRMRSGRSPLPVCPIGIALASFADLPDPDFPTPGRTLLASISGLLTRLDRLPTPQPHDLARGGRAGDGAAGDGLRIPSCPTSDTTVTDHYGLQSGDVGSGAALKRAATDPPSEYELDLSMPIAGFLISHLCKR